ncbi:MAG: large-conductance mechanosensitive channel protein MscL [Oceanicola sp.]|jgi:large conductance mechanosensitive channel|nr:large-conductance mechanosensitive channel protein MscL [Oceanicola sp.]
MLNEFRSFIARGNVMDMAVGIIIGAAFTAIVQSLVNDLINPIIGIFTGGVDMSGLGITLAGEGEDAAVFAYGNFLMAILNFLIVAWAVFMLVKSVNRIKDMASKEEEAAPEADPGPSEKDILIEIRDALQAAK